ncbi:MAG: choice-of-anchor D domain-containing protein [Actinobacteria bacterium]|nr:choice-of-anchor D domain-containing protein [Actinomycetota bacterium]
MSEKKSFWSTIPVIIASLAAVLTGLATIIAFVMGGFGGLTTPAGEPASPEANGSSDSDETSGSSRSSESSGSGRIEPQAVITPKSIDFGSVGVGAEDQQTVTVVNSGNEFLVVDEASISGDEGVFSVDADDCLGSGGIEPQDECEIFVTFEPSSQGSYAGVLEIEHSGPTSPNQVALKGETKLLGL